jgi:hypothetical protein
MYVGKYLFHPSAQYDWTYEDDHLAQMMELAQITELPSTLLQRSKNAKKFCNDDCLPTLSLFSEWLGTLLRIKELQATTPEEIVQFMNPNLDPVEIRAFSLFIADVMKLDPDTRPTATELLSHPWITGFK